LIVAEGLDEDRAKGDRASMPWAEIRPLREFSIAGRSLLWQPGFDVAYGSDLVITEQASKQLFNVVLAYGQRALRTRHAFWGHGKNFQAPLEGSSGEGLKRRLTRRAHWFFAYNELSARAAVEAGISADRVTVVMNATDTAHIRAVVGALPADSGPRVRHELGMGSGPVGVFMGGIYPPKRPQFLLDAAAVIRTLVPDFEMLIIGSGSERDLVESAANAAPWIHYAGPRYGDDRLRLASVASIQLMPGMVGLNIVDAFALGLPTITTDIDYHSPEIDYLIDGKNGVIVSGDPSPGEYAHRVAELLHDPVRLALLQHGAFEASSELTIEHMADNFARGVLDALAKSKRS
jgi:glycosyltransferase involved in cell wall biosynthesis